MCIRDRLIGDYFHLDRITIIDRDDFTQELCWCKDYKHRHLPLEIDGDTALDCASIRDDLSLTSSALSLIHISFPRAIRQVYVSVGLYTALSLSID